MVTDLAVASDFVMTAFLDFICCGRWLTPQILYKCLKVSLREQIAFAINFINGLGMHYTL